MYQINNSQDLMELINKCSNILDENKGTIKIYYMGKVNSIKRVTSYTDKESFIKDIHNIWSDIYNDIGVSIDINTKVVLK